MAESGSSSDHAASERCFLEWMKLQEESQRELFEALNAVENRANSDQETEHQLTKLVDKSIEQFQDYIDRRMQLAKNDVSAFFAPVWCTARETSLLWIAGCRPSLFIRLAYSLTGYELETRLAEFLQGMKPMEELAEELSPQQMKQLDSLQMRTIKEEERLTSELARVQEEMADQTVVGIAMRSMKEEGASEELEKALEKQDGEMLGLIQQADKLRIRTLNELTEILRPLQAVLFIAFSKKLHLCVREWGQRSDRRHGRVGNR